MILLLYCWILFASIFVKDVFYISSVILILIFLVASWIFDIKVIMASEKEPGSSVPSSAILLEEIQKDGC